MPADADTERTVVKTYVPRYQKERWQDDAAALDMTQSEFLRNMVQAGRRKLLTDEPSPPDESSDLETHSTSTNPRGNGLETRLLGALSTDTYLTWDELVDHVTDDVEEQLEELLQTLTQDGTVAHSPRRGGYTLTEDSGDG